MRKLIVMMAMLFVLNQSCFAQSENVRPQYKGADSLLLKGLENQLKNGELRALRDVATLLNTHPEAKVLLDKYTLFPTTQTLTTSSEFLDFFYKSQNQIKFSFLFNAFFYKNISDNKCTFRVVSRTAIAENISAPELLNRLEEAFLQKQFDTIISLLSQGNTPTSTGINTLLIQLTSTALPTQWTSAQRLDFYKLLAEKISYYPNENSFQTLLHLIDEGKLPEALSAFPLARLTNIFAAHEVKNSLIATRYRSYSDSLKTIEAMHLYGYERYNTSLQRFYFDADVDYFGTLFSMAFRTDSYWWIKENALYDMLKTKHPRTLFYLATQVYKEQIVPSGFRYTSDYYYQLLTTLTNEDIHIENKSHAITALDTKDLASAKNYLVYWTTHWEDYEWDEYRKVFVNKKEKLAQKEYYDKLFRRFSSTNDSVAIQSYRELTEGEPAEIAKLAAKYKGLMRNINPNLPDFKYKFLEQLAIFTEYCRINKVRYVPTKEENELFTQLLNPSSAPSLRYIIENQIIKQLTTDQITAFEYWALLHQSNAALNFSVSRILDYWYTKHWSELLQNERELKLYLKKSSVFAQTNASGTMTAYAKKIDFEDSQVQKALEHIEHNTADADIQNLIATLIKGRIDTEEKKAESINNTNQQIESLLTNIKKASNITIDELNNIVQSKAYKPSYRQVCLQALSKVTPYEDIFQLKIQPKLSARLGELDYLNSIPFTIQDLDDIPRIVEADEASKLYNFIFKSAEKSTIDELGGLINNIFRQAWFTNYLASGTFSSEQATWLKTKLQTYLNESELISEFEEQTTSRNLAQLESINLPIEERLAMAFNLPNDDETKLKIMSELIVKINYEDIAKVLPYVIQLEKISGKSAISFLHDDFGIPIFEFENDKALQDFIQRHNTLKEQALYTLYLQKYGLDFQKTDGSLDFDKIYDILKFDLATPYTVANGNRRDDYVYGIIKVLELHFGDRLGFHRKLNEAQTFYSFNAAKRANAWQHYLETKHLIDPSKHSKIVSLNHY